MSDKEIRRGEEARRVLDEPMVKAAFEEVEAGIINAMKLSPLGDEKTHHELVVSLQCLKRVKGWFETHIETGKLARIQKESLTDKAKRILRQA